MAAIKATLKEGTTSIYPQTTDDMVFIEGDANNRTLKDYMREMTASGYLYAGTATPTTNPTTPAQKSYYLATTAGTYTNFSGIVVNAGEAAFLKYDPTAVSPSWVKENTGIPLVSVSQNSQTGHTDINIGSDSYPVASVEEVSQLGQRLSIAKNGVVIKTTDQYGNVLSSITKSGTTNTVQFNDFIVTGNIDAAVGSNSFVAVSTQDSFEIQNLFCLYVNMQTKAISVSSMTTRAQLQTIFADQNNVVLLINLWGRLYSPIATLECELFDFYNNADVIDNLKNRIVLGQNICVIKSGTPYDNIISSIAVASMINTIKFNDFIVTGNPDSVVSGSQYIVFTPSADGYVLQNLDCLYINLRTKAFSVTTLSTTAQLNTIAQDKNNVVLLVNMWGRLYSSIPTLECELAIYYNNADNIPQQITIVVAPDGSGDFTSVRAAVKSITDASAQKRYIVYVKNGTYNEIDIYTKDYVDIVGESRDGVILYTDGTSTANSPADYTWYTEQYSNVPINTIPKAWKHLFIHMSNSTIANMTMKVRMCKYVIHQDNEHQEYDAVVKNCVLIREENFSDNGADTYNQRLQYIVGIGARKGQFQRYYDCSFILNTKDLPDALFTGSIIWHNWNGTQGSKKAGATFKNCSCFGVKSIGEITNLKGAGENDILQFENVRTDLDNSNIISVLSNGYYDASALNKFCIDITSENGILVGDGDGIVEQTINAFAMVKKYSTTAFSKGQPIAIDSVSVATQAPFGVALQDNSANEFIFIGKANVFYGLAVADSYSFGDNAYISNGKFTKVANGNIVGRFIETKTLSTDGLIMIEKI